MNTMRNTRYEINEDGWTFLRIFGPEKGKRANVFCRVLEAFYFMENAA